MPRFHSALECIWQMEYGPGGRLCLKQPVPRLEPGSQQPSPPFPPARYLSCTQSRYPDGAKKARTVTQAGRLGRPFQEILDGLHSCRSCVINSARSSGLLDELACTHTRAHPQRRSSPRQPHLSSAHHLDTTGCVLLTFQKSPQTKTFTANPGPPDHTMGLACPYRYR